ncbi:MAG: diacylglycerol/lipid kinase family protein [Acidimicrobiales bacterium]
MRVVLIVNPAASSVSRRALVTIQRSLARDHDLEVHETTRPRHATRLAHRADRTGADLVVTIGGDGTINEAVNGLLDTDTAVAPLPGGSTNVFARALGYPNDAEAATEVLLEALTPEALEAGSIRRGSVGMAGDRAFVFHVGVGFDAAVVHRVERRGPLKRWAGHPWFVASALRTWASDERRQLAFAVEDDDRRISPIQMAVALNVDPYTFLGNRPLRLAPEAGLDRPLSMVALERLDARSLGPAAWAALRGREDGLPDAPPIHHWRDLDRILVRSPRPFPFQLDGEPMDPVNELELRHRPDAVRFVIPRAARA